MVTRARSIPNFGPILEDGWNLCPLSWSAVIMTINNVITLSITLAIVFVAPIMLAYSGFLLVTNAFNPSAKEDAKKMITNAIVGIVIALAAWMIVDALMAVLYHPTDPEQWGGTWSELITGGGIPVCIPVASSLHQVAPGVGAAGVSPDGTVTTAPSPVGPGQYTHAEALAVLQAHGNISLSSTGGCSDPNNRSCTSLEGIPRGAITNITGIQTLCNCGITISGGTETGHLSHGQGLPVVDFNYSDALLRGIRAAGYNADTNFSRGATCEPPGRPGVAMACGPGTGHIHMEL